MEFHYDDFSLELRFSHVKFYVYYVSCLLLVTFYYSLGKYVLMLQLIFLYFSSELKVDVFWL